MNKPNHKGFTLVELAIGLAVIAVLILSIAVGSGVLDSARVQSAGESVRTLRAAAENYIASGNLTYTGISIDNLKTSKFLPSGFSATGSNPWNGDFQVAVNASDSTQVDISLTTISQQTADRLDSLFANTASSTSYNTDSQIWTVTF